MQNSIWDLEIVFFDVFIQQIPILKSPLDILPQFASSFLCVINKAASQQFAC